MAAVERQLGVQHSAPNAESLEEEPEAVALIHAVDEEQHLALQQAQLQQHHHIQQLVLPVSHDIRLPILFCLFLFSLKKNREHSAH